MKKYRKIIAVPFGKILLEANEVALTGLYLNPTIYNGKEVQNSIITRAEAELKEYFSNERECFTVPLQAQGTPFQLRCWEVLKKIPYGEVISYQKEAELLGNARKARAVGSANGKNPIAIIIPCHRVIRKNGDLGGFGGGEEIKQFLLDLEMDYKKTKNQYGGL